MESRMPLQSFFKQEFFLNTIVHWVLIMSFLINGVCWGILLFFIRPVDFPIILHYNVYFGVDMIGSWWQVYFLPSIALVIMGINLFLAYFFYKHKERVLSYLFLLASFMVQVGVAIAIAGIIMINY